MSNIDEKKIVSDIETESAGLKDYMSFLRLNNEYRLKRQQQKIFFITVFLGMYSVFAFVFLSAFRDHSAFVFWPFQVSNNGQMNNIQTRLDTLDEEIKNLKGSLSTTTADDNSVNYLKTRISALEDTISLDPEKALTAVLLREKQKNLEDNLSELRSEQSRLESKVDNLMITVLIGPVIAGFLGLLIWFIQKRFTKKEE